MRRVANEREGQGNPGKRKESKWMRKGLEVTEEEEEEEEQTGKNHEHASTVIICETSAWLAEQQPLLR